MFLFIFFVLPTLTQQYTIKLNGKVEMGDQVSSFLKEIYKQFLNGDKVKGVRQTPDVKREEASADQTVEIPAIDEIMSKNEISHLYGEHKDEKPMRNNIKV
ncbi:hypothetical protein KGM_214854 [Danaus plexippus plexippus]|uniref:Uncharacterized protein n=1 Tax=Danaus plexippus plexippus TaxID=278856 RepID=A0A212EK78_DANPL|nr:hypothetical protein KGM_214854 [Danaus plexippus plexippus]